MAETCVLSVTEDVVGQPITHEYTGTENDIRFLFNLLIRLKAKVFLGMMMKE